MKNINALWLSIAFVASLMVPVLILLYTEHNPFWASVASLLMPLGGYMVFASLARHSGWMVWLGFPFIFLSAFQVVLSYLFGNSVIATDMFLNLLTTNADEAGELLANIYPAIIAVILIYIPILYIATTHIRRRVLLRNRVRVRMAAMGVATYLLGSLALVGGCGREVKHVVRDELFPINVIYNMGLAITESDKIDNFRLTSHNFTYNAKREHVPDCREIYVFIIGEASRAASWQLYGYDRETNPLLSKRDDLRLFTNVLTQSNTTHKSVPLMLSSVHTSRHNELYRRSGLPALFNEAGFTTYFISNQSPQGAMIDKLALDAKYVRYVDSPRLDMQLVDVMRSAIAEDSSEKMLFILHTYGSHFSYAQRYPQEFAHFLPDDEVAIKRKNVEMIRNAYDNSIRYTDYFINEVIESLDALDGVASAIFYCADHGEDLFDGEKKRFLHSSPTVTYHQLHVASLAWLSPLYCELYPEKAEAAAINMSAPATTHSVFHTLADMASISSPYVELGASLVNRYFDYGAIRYYLDDHNHAVKLDSQIGIDAEERAFFARHGIEL